MSDMDLSLEFSVDALPSILSISSHTTFVLGIGLLIG